MRKRIFILLGLLIMALLGRGIYLYFMPRQDISQVAASIYIDATDIYEQYQKDESSANRQYLEKVIEVTGIIQDFRQIDNTLTIQLKGGSGGGINCLMRNPVIDKKISIQQGSRIKVKGRCNGFLMDVNLTDCVIKNP